MTKRMGKRKAIWKQVMWKKYGIRVKLLIVAVLAASISGCSSIRFSGDGHVGRADKECKK